MQAFRPAIRQRTLRSLLGPERGDWIDAERAEGRHQAADNVITAESPTAASIVGASAGLTPASSASMLRPAT